MIFRTILKMCISINWQYYFYTSECKYARFDPARIYFFGHPQGLSLQLIKILYNIHLFYTIEFCPCKFVLFFPFLQKIQLLRSS